MKYVIGIDLGTSAVKIIVVNQNGNVIQQISKSYPLIQERSGYSEQDPEDWVKQTILGLKELTDSFNDDPNLIEGISFSGQMHGLVLLDQNKDVLRNAILWNDTRTTEECKEINNIVGKERLLKITKNPALEGFTLPKLLWVRKHERELFDKVSTFLLPKDYLRYRLTGKIHMDYSDAAGTLLLDIDNKRWSNTICELLEIDPSICPKLINSHEYVGGLLPHTLSETGLSSSTKVFAGGADNACGAIGSGIIEEGLTLCSVGTSGVVLAFESDGSKKFDKNVHFFNHGVPNSFYAMGVTLSAGYSLNWFQETFAENETFEVLLSKIENIPIGANGLLFTPYLMGERTPHADSMIRATFTGIDSSHTRSHFIRAVIEGITFSLKETIEIFREHNKQINQIVSIGGGAKSEIWLQIQADIFNAEVVTLTSEQGPSMGAAMIAAVGCKWFNSFIQCAEIFVQKEKSFHPNDENVMIYKEVYKLYKQVYLNTYELHKSLHNFR